MHRCRLFTLFILLVLGSRAIVLADEIVTERVRITWQDQKFQAGDTLSFEGLITRTDNVEAALSRYVYVELIGQNDSVMGRRKYRCDDSGRIKGRFPIEKHWGNGVYYVRSYTRLMQNFSPSTFFVHPLPVGCDLLQGEAVPTRVYSHFYPEGGVLVEGSPQSMVVYLTDANSHPVSVPFQLISGKDTLSTSVTSSAGMALITVSPSSDQNYQLHTQCGGKQYVFHLPKPQQGVSLQASVNRNRINYSLTGESDAAGYSLLCYSDQIGIRQIALNGHRNGSIDWTGLVMKGVLSFLLLNQENKPVAYRSLLLDAQESENPLSCDDMLSDVPLLGHLDRNDLKMWMMTARFQRFDISRVASEGFSYTNPYEDVLTISGQLTNRFDRPYSHATVFAYNRNSYQTTVAVTDENGRYTIAIDDFPEGQEFFISAQVGKKKQESGFFHYNIQDDAFPAVFIPYRVLRDYGYADSQTDVAQKQSGFNFDKLNNLPEVTVKARYKEVQNPDFDSKKFYGARYIPIYENEDMYMDFKSVIDRIPNLDLFRTESSTGYTYSLTTTRGLNQEVAIMLDGAYISAEEAWFLDPHQLEDVEFLTPREALRYSSFAFNGLLVIRTRIPEARRAGDKKAKGVWFAPLGLTKL